MAVMDENDRLIAGKLPADPKADAKPVNQKAMPVAQRYGLLSVADLMQLALEEINKPKPKRGVSTIHEELDVAIGGFRPGNITVFGAKRGFGKTSYGNKVTLKAFEDGYRVLSIVGEDPALMYGKRLLADRAQLNAMLLRDNRVNKDDWPRITEAIAGAPKVPYFVRTNGRPIEWVAKLIQELGKEEQIDLVVVDYLQCTRAGSKQQDRRNEVTYVMGQLCDSIRGIGAAGLLLSQLKRSEREEPETEDLKESGDIEDKADHILMGWKKELKGGGAERWVKVVKNKDGIDASEISPEKLNWNSKTASFEFTKHVLREWDDVADNYDGANY